MNKVLVEIEFDSDVDLEDEEKVDDVMGELEDALLDAGFTGVICLAMGSADKPISVSMRKSESVFGGLT